MEGLSSTIAEEGLRDRLNIVVSNASTLWQRGLFQHPDFTLHGVVHSQTIDRLIQEFSEHITLAPSLNDREKFILVSAIYLHDLGMLFPLDSFVEDQANSDASLRRHDKATCCEIAIKRFCKGYGYEENACEFFEDLEERPLPQKMRTGEIVRQFHHLFSDYMIRRHWQILGLPRQAASLVARVSKGHRAVDLSKREYDDTRWSGSPVRLGALAALLRVSDELDFSSERAPDILLEIFMDDLIHDPHSLTHWIRHFCIRSVGPLEFVHRTGGYVEPVINIVADIPSEDYKSIIDEQMRKSISQVSTQDVKDRLQSLGLCCPLVKPEINIDPSATNIPRTLQDRIGNLKVTDFLRQQMENIVVEEEENLIREGFANDKIAKMVGYRRRLYKVEYDCLNKDQTKVTWEVQIKATQQLSHVRHFYEADEPFKSISDLSFENLTPVREINPVRKFVRANTRREIDLTIDPPLEQGEEASYRFSEIYHGLFEYSVHTIAQKIAEGLWPFPDTVEAAGSEVLVPTDELELSVLLPEGIEIEKPGFRLQMTGTTLPHETEEKRLRELDCFKTDVTDKRSYIQLVVPDPKLMVIYWILWVPKA